MILEIMGYSALMASVAGSTIVFLKDKYSIYAFLLWSLGNPIFIYLLIIGFAFAKELFFVAYMVMTYTAVFGIYKKGGFRWVKRFSIKGCFNNLYNLFYGLVFN